MNAMVQSLKAPKQRLEGLEENTSEQYSHERDDYLYSESA